MSYFVSSRVKSFREQERKSDKRDCDYIRENRKSKAERGEGLRSKGIAYLAGQSKRQSEKQINRKTTERGVKPFTNGCDSRVRVYILGGHWRGNVFGNESRETGRQRER